MQRDLPEPPDGLQDVGRRQWDELVAAYVFTEAELTVLRDACFLADLCEQLRQSLAASGTSAPDRFGQLKQHPDVQTYLSAQRELRMALRELRLDDAPEASRAPRLYA